MYVLLNGVSVAFIKAVEGGRGGMCIMKNRRIIPKTKMATNTKMVDTLRRIIFLGTPPPSGDISGRLSEGVPLSWRPLRSSPGSPAEMFVLDPSMVSGLVSRSSCA